MRSRLDEQLAKLNAGLMELGAMIEYAIDSGAKALIQRDIKLAETIMEYDREIDQKERDIEALCLTLLLKQQPVARDLRFISAALKMITDMERIGDQAADISELVVMMNGAPHLMEPIHIPAMADASIAMVKRSIDAFVARDAKMAGEVIRADDEVDALFDKVRAELTQLIASDPTCGAQALDLLMIAKYLERIGDHAVNIAQWVCFAVTGVHKGE